MKLLLDTNAYTALMRGDAAVAAKVQRSEGICMSAVVVGELLLGFRLGARFSQNQQQMERFMDNPYVEFLPVTRLTTEHFASLAATLKRRGTPLPTNDIWIAAQALERGAVLLSDDAHFGQVDGILWRRLAE